jgi:hypothetical protein
MLTGSSLGTQLQKRVLNLYTVFFSRSSHGVSTPEVPGGVSEVFRSVPKCWFEANTETYREKTCQSRECFI